MAKCVMNLAALRQTIGAQPLHFAVRLGLLKESFASSTPCNGLQHLIQQMHILSATNIASFSGRPQACTALIECKAEVDAQTNTGRIHVKR